MINLFFPKTKILKKTFYPSRLRIKKNSDTLKFGFYGIKLLNNCCLSIKQLETIKKLVNKIFKKCGKIWIRAFCHFFMTRKPLEVRMGNGKGSFSQWIVNLPKGFIILEFEIINLKIFLDLSKLIKNLQSKIGIKLKLINKYDLL